MGHENRSELAYMHGPLFDYLHRSIIAETDFSVWLTMSQYGLQ